MAPQRTYVIRMKTTRELTVDERLERALGEVRSILWLHEDLWTTHREAAVQVLIAEHALRAAQRERGGGEK